MVAAGGHPRGGIGWADPGSPYAGIAVYVQVANVDTALTRAEQRGGRRTLDPPSVPGMGRMAVCTDPDGNPVGLLSP